jgi:hypothetical protein
MVFEAFSQLGLPAPHLATSSAEPWLVALVCIIIWLALTGGRTTGRGTRTSHA